MKFDVILVEHAPGDGLSVEEISDMVRSFDKDDELLPIETNSKLGDSSAMGFITTKAEDHLYSKVTETDFEEYIGSILSDISLEHEDNKYRYESLDIWLARYAPDAFENPPRVEVTLEPGKVLVAERNSDTDYKEIYIGLEKDGVWYQSLALVRESYRYDESGTKVVPEHGVYEIKVWEIPKDDPTEELTIHELKEE